MFMTTMSGFEVVVINVRFSGWIVALMSLSSSSGNVDRKSLSQKPEWLSSKL